VLLTATLKGEGGQVELTADEVVALDGIESRRAAALRIVLDLDSVDEGMLEQLRELLLAHPGELPVRFELVRRGRFRARLVPPVALTVDPSPELRSRLNDRLGGGRFEFEFDEHPANGKAHRAGVAEVPDEPRPPVVVN